MDPGWIVLFSFLAEDLKPGDPLLEASHFSDPLTGKKVIRLTSGRDFNHLPAYHNNTDFTSDSKALVFSSWPKDRSVSYLMKADLETGLLTVIAALPALQKKGRFNGNNMALSQTGGWILAYTYAYVGAYQIDSREERIFAWTNAGCTFGHPAGSLDGNTVFIARKEVLPSGSYRYTVLGIDLASLESRELFSEEHSHCNHIQPNPRNPDELLITREEELTSVKIPVQKEFYLHPRMIVLNLKTQKIVEIAPVMPERKWIVHMVWNHLGDQLYYELKDDRAQKHELGIASPLGLNLWQKTIPRAGMAVHVGAHPLTNWMVVEGGVFEGPRRFLFLKPDANGKNGEPILEDIATHDSEVESNTQESHGHSRISPAGKWMAYNVQKNARSDVFVVKLK
ncbi:MAG: hypothetical protein JNM63_04305 [Spirochaetia bacterium]|nr:hypothetical protein [Spirochaetia bacterium]